MRYRVSANALCLSLLALVACGCGTVGQGQNDQGVRLYQQGNYQAAALSFQRAIQSNPQNADAYYNLARLHHRQGNLQNNSQDFQQAETYYNMCLDHAPHDVDCYRSLAVLLVQQNRSSEAMTLLERWAAANPTNPEPKIELARVSEEFGKQEEAKNYLLAAIADDPNNARALAALGQIREKTGETAQAMVNYQRSLQHDPFNTQVASRLAALNAAQRANSQITPPGGSRVVTTPDSTRR
ncbi:MAG: tetratricopeptide repeat protein [Pirellulales bacterium]|nr:tetratricopeptide repeat protein [Pirellulales bacterium]